MAKSSSAQVNTAPRVRFEFDSKPHGEGGFGKVIKGRDNDLGRDIAVKVLNPLLTFSEAEKERFRREARVLARLSHPNIPAVYDVVFGPDEFLIVFQFVEGKTLRGILEDEGAAELSQVQSWFRQIASALDHAHSEGMVHRDIKPDNIIITPDRESAYLVDWGIALSQEEASRLTSGGWIGTPGYMSPEQQSGDNIDSRSDLYSLGVTLYEALAGFPIPQGQYRDLSLINQAVPPGIDELVHSCLEPKEGRIESARAFASRLATALVPTRPLSEVLAHGRLHEIALALRSVTPQGFTQLPQGQRALVFVKLDDLVNSDDPNLKYATAEFLELLIIRGIQLGGEQYQEIAVPAVNRAFEVEFDGRVGRRSLRNAIEEAALLAQGEVFEILAQSFLSFVDRTDLDSKHAWLLQEMRETLQTLLANPACSESSADPLAEALRKVNRAQRARTRNDTIS
jgi:serine/threonine protein kinase